MRLENTFGKYEMEEAAAVIVNKIIDEDNWLTPLSVLDFQPTDDFLRGFECLIGYGWLRFVDDGGQPYYVVKRSFYNRIKANYPFEDVPPWTRRKK